MRIESSVTSVSWIPSEALPGAVKVPFALGVTHYDDPPPDQLDDLGALQAAGRFRFANDLRAWIEVVDGKIVDAGFSGGGRMGITNLSLGSMAMTVATVALPDLRAEPEIGEGAVRFAQTAGGRAGLPAPRRVKHAPFVKVEAPLVWTTLALTLRADGSSEHEVVGASGFPRHWVYDRDGHLAAKVGLLDFKGWYRKAFGRHTPWGDRDSPALVTAVETALERELSREVMRGGAEPRIKKVGAGKTLVKQGSRGTDVFLLLDGVLDAEVDGKTLAQFGPGAILGERAVVEGGVRTATLRARTRCKVAVVAGTTLDSDALRTLREEHRKEDR